MNNLVLLYWQPNPNPCKETAHGGQLSEVLIDKNCDYFAELL